MHWRSSLEFKLKSGELTPGNVRAETAGSSGLVRATIVNNRYEGEFFFKPGAGPELDRDHYVARCFMPFAWEEGRVHCSTHIDVETFDVEIKFDRAFLWDFGNVQAQAVAAAKHYIARPSTQHMINGIPR